MDKDRAVELIMEFETEGLDEENTIKLFQHLVDTGQAWSLQGMYGRMATSLIESGHDEYNDYANRVDNDEPTDNHIYNSIATLMDMTRRWE